jgi:5-formyltetrahydrofolate cyclo-ligase
MWRQRRREKTRAEIRDAREEVRREAAALVERERRSCICYGCAEFVAGFCPYQQSPQQKTCARFRGEK